MEKWLFFVGLSCMAHRLSAVFKTSLSLTRKQIIGFDRMITGCTSLINVINKSSWRSKMKPSLKSAVPTRFWGHETMWGSVIPNYEKMTAFARDYDHSDKIRFRKSTAQSFFAALTNIKSLIKQIEVSVNPTIHSFMPSITMLYNVKLKATNAESAYSKRFKSNVRMQYLYVYIFIVHCFIQNDPTPYQKLFLIQTHVSL